MHERSLQWEHLRWQELQQPGKNGGQYGLIHNDQNITGRLIKSKEVNRARGPVPHRAEKSHAHRSTRARDYYFTK